MFWERLGKDIPGDGKSSAPRRVSDQQIAWFLGKYSRSLAEAADCLEEAIAARIDDGRDIPSPSADKRGELNVSVPPSMALKAARPS
jgi:hypothetical protein